MIRPSLITAFVCCSLLSFSQPNNTDSLKQVLRQSNLSPTDRVKTYQLLGRRSLDSDPKITIAYIDSALAIATPSNDTRTLLPSLYINKGLAYRRQSIFGEALKNYNLALDYARELNDRSSEGLVYMSLATVAEMTGEAVKAIELNQQALDSHIALKDTANIVTVYNNLGIIYMDKGDFDGALKYYRKAIALNNLRGNILANARTINNIGLVFQKQNQFDSALFYYQSALSVLDVNQQKYGYALVTNNIGICYRALHQYDRALEYFVAAKKLQGELNDLYGLGLSDYNISQIYYWKGDYQKSLQLLREASDYAAQASSLSLKKQIVEEFAMNYEKLGDFRNAFAQQKQYSIYSDSLQAKSLSQEIADLEVKYQVKQQQDEIELLKSQNELHVATAQNKDLILLAIIGFSTLILLLLVFAWRSLKIRQRTHLIIKEKNERLEHLHHEKNSLMAIVAHDLISPLNSIASITDVLPRLGPLNEPQTEFVGMITSVVDGGRTLVKDVMDLSALENKELKVHLESVSIDALIAECKAKYMGESIRKEINIEIAETPPLPPVITDRSHVNRILQNLVSNALKFSSAGTTIRIGASRTNGTLAFFVSDEGPGISADDQKLMFRKFMKLSARPTDGESSTGLGLSIVKGLVEELGGNVEVKSIVGKGTTFTCHLPVKGL